VRMLILPTREGYDRWSQVYDGDGNPLLALEEPLVAEWLGEPAGLVVADIGCGTGRHALRVAQAGAQVTAVDFSTGMMAQARTKPGADRVRFVEHDLAQALPLPERSFDRVLCCLVMEHVPALAALFGELGRICRPDGRVIVTHMHPAMMLRGVQARFWDPATGQDIRPESQPHQISDYVVAAVQGGLGIDSLVERAVDPALAQALPRAEKYLGWPMLFAMNLTPRAANR
jgi:ubiquinone/menaquinone biosynthesis C-methylase UbiE